MKRYESNDDDATAKQHLVILPKRAAMVNSEDFKASFSSAGVTSDSVSCIFKQDYTFLPLKPDHNTRPLWVCHDEAFSPLAEQAQDFLITISEPVSRPSRMHEYKLTPYSLFAAVAVGMETTTIIQVLERFSKVKVPEDVIKFINDCTLSYGKVKLVLKLNRYFIESNYPETIRRLLKDDTLRQAHIPSTIDDKGITSIANPLIKKEEEGFSAVITLDREDEEDEATFPSTKDSKGLADLDESDFTSSFEIDRLKVEEIRKRCVELDFPLTEEYDFRNDTSNANLDIDLSPKCIIRDYQEKSLS